MRFLPYDTFTLQTPDPLPIVMNRLAAQIEPTKIVRWSFSRNHLPYQGTFSETGFQISRIIHNRNSFLPMIRGQFESSSLGTSVHITMRLHPVVIAFLSCWYLFWYGIFFPVWLTGSIPATFALLFLGSPIALLLVFWGAFWAEASRSRGDLEQIILGQVSINQRSRHSRARIVTVILWGSLFVPSAITACLQITGVVYLKSSVESESLGTAACAQYPNHAPICHVALIQTLDGHPKASALAMSKDGQTLASGGTDKAIKVWDLKTGRLKKTLQSDSGEVKAVAIAPDGKTVVSGSADHMVRIWDLASGHPRLLAGHPEAVNVVRITPDGKTVISGSYGAIKQWDLGTGQLKATFPKVGKTETNFGPISVIHDEAEQFNPLDINTVSNTTLIGDLELVDLANNAIKAIPTDNVKNVFEDYFLSAHMSPDGKLAVLQFGNNFRKFETRFKIWNLSTGKVQAVEHGMFSQHSFKDMPLVVSRDHIFGSTGKQLKVWNLQTAQLEAVLDMEPMDHLVISTDGNRLAGLSSGANSNDAQIKVWQIPSQ
jgi:WD40 repeat protein